MVRVGTPAALGVIVDTGSSGTDLGKAARRWSALKRRDAATAPTPDTLAIADAKGKP
jgi:hypothetical protein